MVEVPAGDRRAGQAVRDILPLLLVQLSSLRGGVCSAFLRLLMCREVLQHPWMVISALCESSLCLRSPSEAPERNGSVSGLQHTRPRLSVPRHFHPTSCTSGSTPRGRCLHTGPPVFPPAALPPVLLVEAASGSLAPSHPVPPRSQHSPENRPSEHVKMPLRHPGEKVPTSWQDPVWVL